MAKFGYNEWNKFNEGGGTTFFSLKPQEQAIVRFVYNDLNDIEMYSVHEFRIPGNMATISCAKPTSDSPIDMCKWCKMGNVPVARIVIPIFKADTEEIVYWTRTRKFVNDTLVPLFNEILSTGKPISSQQYKIIRQGEGLQTSYSVIPTGMADDRTKDTLGIVKDPYETGIIKESDFDYDPNRAPQNNQQGVQQGYGQQQNYGQQNYGGQQNYNQGYGQQQATRRTTDMF